MTDVKVIAALVAAAALAALVFVAYQRGVSSGRNAVQVQWDADKLAIAATAAAAVAKATQDRDAALAANGVIDANLQTERAQTASSIAAFADRVHRLEISLAAGSDTLSKTGDLAGSAQARAATSDARFGQLARLAAAARAECLNNADSLDALIHEINAQL